MVLNLPWGMTFKVLSSSGSFQRPSGVWAHSSSTMHMTLYHIHSFLQTSQQFRGLRHVGDTYHAHCSLSVGTVMELSTAEGLQATSLAPETAICHLISSSRQPSEAKESLLPGQFNVVFTFQGKNLEPGYIKTVQLRSDRAGWEPGLVWR